MAVALYLAGATLTTNIILTNNVFAGCGDACFVIDAINCITNAGDISLLDTNVGHSGKMGAYVLPTSSGCSQISELKIY